MTGGQSLCQVLALSGEERSNMKDDMNEKKIKNEDLESVSGGYIFDATKIDRSPETGPVDHRIFQDVKYSQCCHSQNST